LNVNNEKPTTSLNTVLRELSVGAYQFQREDVLAAFFNKFEKFFDLFQNQGTVLISHEIDLNVCCVELFCFLWLCYFL
jgi:biotin--protein ligase